jgi:hypothetical protein
VATVADASAPSRVSPAVPPEIEPPDIATETVALLVLAELSRTTTPFVEPEIATFEIVYEL